MTYRRTALAAVLGLAAFASLAHAQELAPRADDADIGTSYALRKSLHWFDRTIPWRAVYGVAYADIDRDGRMDIVMAPVNFGGGGAAEPIRVLMNTGLAFEDQTNTRLTAAGPGVVHARETIAGDFNGDGWVDVFIAGHGYDVPPFPGEAPQLFLNNGDGTLRYDAQFEGQVGFNHGAASGDIDRDGDIDILVVQQHHAHVLVNDGAAHFTRDDTRLPAEAEWMNWFTGELVDLDRDGYLDAMLGGHEYEGAPTVVYWGAPGGHFSASRKTVLPAVAGKGIVLAYGAEDIDGDGDRDLVISRTGSDPFYSGRYLQVLVQTQPRAFADESAARITMDTTQPWIDYLRLQDINGDQYLDILHDDKGAASQGQAAWINNGAGVFTPYAGPVTPAPTLEITDASLAEGDAGSQPMTFTVRASQPLLAPVNFDIHTENGTAWAGGDFEPSYQPGLVIAPTQRTLAVQIPVLGDPWVEDHERFAAVIGYASGAVVARPRGIGTILNDDKSWLSIADAGIVEGNAGQQTMTFVVTLSWPMPTPVTFDIATSSGSAQAGSDYVARAQAGRLMDAGRTRAVFEVPILGDAVGEATETFNVTLSNVNGAMAGRSTAVGTVFDDDPMTAAPATATAAAAFPRVALPASTAPAPPGGACARLREQIVRLETQVAAGVLPEARGVRRILAEERKASALGCR